MNVTKQKKYRSPKSNLQSAFLLISVYKKIFNDLLVKQVPGCFAGYIFILERSDKLLYTT